MSASENPNESKLEAVIQVQFVYLIRINYYNNTHKLGVVFANNFTKKRERIHWIKHYILT